MRRAAGGEEWDTGNGRQGGKREKRDIKETGEKEIFLISLAEAVPSGEAWNKARNDSWFVKCLCIIQADIKGLTQPLVTMGGDGNNGCVWVCMWENRGAVIPQLAKIPLFRAEPIYEHNFQFLPQSVSSTKLKCFIVSVLLCDYAAEIL